MTETIYRPWNHGLGDRWASLNLLLRKAETERSILYVSDADRGRLHEEILTALNAPIARLRSVPESGNTSLDGFNVWAAEFYPTITQWVKPGHSAKVAVHFDGVSSAADKNPSSVERAAIIDHLSNLGYEPVFLGPHQTIAEAVDVLATAAFFVGVDSGFSHVAHSVGVPMFLLQYKLPVVTCHRGKPYILCEGARDFIDHKLKTWLNYRKFLGL